MHKHNKSSGLCYLLWRKKAKKSDLLSLLETVRTYVSDSDLIFRLVRCTYCGQLYTYKFTESIDWAGGNDPQYRTWTPVVSTRQDLEASKLEVPMLKPSLGLELNMDWPAEMPKAPEYATLRKTETD